MKYRQREENVQGESPYVEVRLNGDGTEAHVKVQYCRSSVRKDVKTMTFGVLDLGWLTLEDLACVGRTMVGALVDARDRHVTHTTDLLDGIENERP